MDYSGCHDITIGGKRFRDLDDLEDFCYCFPEFENELTESDVLYASELKAQVDSYYIAAELEYGDGNVTCTSRSGSGWYGDVLLGEDEMYGRGTNA